MISPSPSSADVSPATTIAASAAEIAAWSAGDSSGPGMNVTATPPALPRMPPSAVTTDVGATLLLPTSPMFA